jgi:hypothetical protein
MATRRDNKGGAIFWVLIGVILLALPMAYVVFLAPKAAAPPPPVASRIPELKISEVSGQVQVRRGSGEWAVARQGERLRSSDGVKTADGSRAVLAAGDAYEVKMEAGTEVSVAELSETISRLQLGAGMATARVKGHKFEVRATGSDATATTSEGTFAMSNNGAGTVAVGTREGEVQLIGKGKMVIVRAGQQAIVLPGQGPTEPVAIPTSLLLKVSLPSALETANAQAVIAGNVAPGSLVEINGRRIKVDAVGKFTMPMVLRRDWNQVEVKGLGVGGQTADSTHRIKLDNDTGLSMEKPVWK